MNTEEREKLILGLRVLWWSLLLINIVPFIVSVAYPITGLDVQYFSYANETIFTLLGLLGALGVYLSTQACWSQSHLGRAYLGFTALSFTLGVLNRFFLESELLSQASTYIGTALVIMAPIYFMQLSKKLGLDRLQKLWLILLAASSIESIFNFYFKFIEVGHHSGPSSSSMFSDPKTYIYLVIAFGVWVFHLYVLKRFRFGVSHLKDEPQPQTN